ncbi:DMT family transporter [Deinococcus pimensis]|uniref:DMT family transporter n=1 Tax=Deinococcus pimensis TaxID=309888 RepID=UPI0005EB005D|nr:EamA family transporter [Deinococcus pimensis]
MSLAVARTLRSSGVFLVLLSAVLWGTVGVTVASLYRLADVDATTVGVLRLALSVPALLAATVLLRQQRGLRLNLRFALLILLMGLAMAAYQVCYFAAVREAGVAVAVLISLCTAPVWVALLSTVVFRERLRPHAVGLLFAALIGAALLVYRPHGLGTDGADLLVGALLALGAALSYAVIALTSRALAPLASPLVSLTAAFSLSTAVLLPLTWRDLVGVTLPLPAWGLLVYLGVVTTALGYVLFLRGMRTTPATLASVVTLLEPLVAVLLAALLLGERLAPLGLLGAVVLLVAVGLLSTMFNKEGGQ